MPTITRDRGCLYYFPWISMILAALIGGSIGIWASYTVMCKADTVSALAYLNLSLDNLDIVKPALIATCTVYASFAVLILLLALWRSFVEAGHDATGLTTTSSTLLLVANPIASSLWFLLVLWTVFAILGDALWMFLVYIGRRAIDKTLRNLATYGPPVPAWLPSSGQPCPGQCLNLTYFSWFKASLEDACICNATLLQSANADFKKAFRYLPAVQAGVWGLFFFGLLLLLNLTAQFSHTRREKDLITRLTHKQFQYV